MKEPRINKTRRILLALLDGEVLTPYTANKIGGTTDGTRKIRKLREEWPIKSEKVKGEDYYRYWIDQDFLYDWWQNHKKDKYVTSISNKICQ